MNVLIVSFFNRWGWAYHLGTELELAEKHIQQGDSVTFLTCDGSVGACIVNPEGNIDVCNECRLKRIDGISQLSGDVVVHSLKTPLSKLQALEAANLPNPPTLDDYKALRYNGHDLGWAALSSTISHYRDPLIEGKEARQSAKVLLAAAIHSYEGTMRFLSKYPDFDLAYIFNGRFAVTRGALRALQDNQVPFITHDRGSTMHKYELYPNTIPHDRMHCQKRILEAWEDPEKHGEKEKIAHQFYREKKEGKAPFWKNFAKDQLASTLPRDWDEDSQNVVIFSHSEDELAAIGDDFINSVYPSQSEAVLRIASDTLAAEKQIHYYLRVHPNLSGVENSSLHNFLAINFPNLTVIGPDEKISTYALLDACDCVLSFASTMGVEATYAGKPSILVGPSFYDRLNAAYQPTSHEEVMELLLQSDLPPKSNLGALKYGYFQRTKGIPFEYWKPIDLKSGHFGSLFFSPDVSWLSKRYPLHNKLYLLFSDFCRNDRSRRLADKAAGAMCMLVYRARNLCRRAKRVFA